MAGESGMVSVTVNGGISWTSPISISPYCITDISFVNNQKGYAVGGKGPCWLPVLPEKGFIWKTLDGGYIWTVDDSSWNESIESIFIVNDSLAFAVGERGLILKNSNLYYNGIGEINNTVIAFFSFPNPATNEIRIENANSIIESIEIYNVLGKRIYSEQLQTSDLKPQTVNVSTWNAGMYFVKLRGEKEERVGKFVKQ
jgi:hypothetical protein